MSPVNFATLEKNTVGPPVLHDALDEVERHALVAPWVCEQQRWDKLFNGEIGA